MMRKIILAFDGDNFSEGAFEFARQVNEHNPVLLAGIFLPQIIFSNPLSDAKGGKPVPLYTPLINDEYTGAVEKNIERFKMLCLSNGIEYRVHKDFLDFPLHELKTETRYADLLILGSETFYEELGITQPNVYLEDMLHHSECPVIVVPEKFNFCQSAILTYDGSSDSVFAIKQFAYLFPELNNTPTLTVFSDKKNGDLPDKSNIEELAARHFSDLVFFNLDMDFKEYFRSWTIQKSVPIIVAGSYGRSAFSQLFKKSFIAEIITDYKTPVFIAHR
jgi:nucleotide-binding universal stress UspA family protein